MEDHQLIAAEAACGVVRAEAADHPACHLTQHLIATAVAERIVHAFEVVEIDEQDRDACTVMGLTRELALQPIEQHLAVGKPRQRVMRRRIAQPIDHAPQAIDLRVLVLEQRTDTHMHRVPECLDSLSVAM